MTDVFVTLLWVQAGGAIWLAFVLQLVYRCVYREQFLHFWSLSFAVLGAGLLYAAVQLLFGHPSYIPYLLGLPQYPLIALAALSLKPVALSRRRQILVLAGSMAGLLVLCVAMAGLAAGPLRLLADLRFERAALNAVVTTWFSIAFWRRHYFAHTTGGRVTALFTSLYALHNVVQAISVSVGVSAYGMDSVSSAVAAATLPFGIAAGMILLATQSIVATTKSLRDSEERYRTVLEASPDGIVATDPPGTILTCNRRAAEVHGYASAAELIGKPATMLIAPADRDRVRAAVFSTSTQGRPVQLECQIVLPGGGERSAELSTAPLRSGDGALAGSVTIVHDITERKEADRALRREREFSANVIDSIPGVFVVLDRERRYLRWNRNLEQVLGRSSDQILRADALADFDAEDRPGLAGAIEKVFTEGTMEAEVRTVPGPGGKARHFYLTGRRMDLDGVAYLVGCGVDITERKEAEAARANLESQLLQSQKLESVGRLAGGVAHDFNNLLTVINGYSDLILVGLEPQDPLRDSLTEIRKAGGRAAELTRQLLAFSRKQIVVPRQLSLNESIMEAREMIGRMVGEDIEIVTDLDPEPGRALADPGQLHQVLMNLVVNARDAMPAGGRLTLRTSRVHLDDAAAAALPGALPGPYAVMEVSDTGVGMSEEIQQQIFEPFFTTKAEGSGTGLGLSTVYGIVRQGGGWIAVESRPDMGATFRIGLPLIEEPVPQALPDTLSIRALEGSETVLVVEDQEEVRKFALAVLARFGYRTLEASSGGDALRIAQEHSGPIHLMLTDVVMPNMTGRQLAARLRAVRPEIKVLYMSGYAADVISRLGVLDSGIEYIEKPFAPEALALKVRKAIGQPAQAKRVLVVDHEEGIRGFFGKVLANSGYQVDLACDGEQACQVLKNGSFELVITDLAMPNREGIETIQAIRRSHPGLKIIAVSGAFGENTPEALGADAILTKPVKPDQLLETVRKTLG